MLLVRLLSRGRALSKEDILTTGSVLALASLTIELFVPVVPGVDATVTIVTAQHSLPVVAHIETMGGNTLVEGVSEWAKIPLRAILQLEGEPPEPHGSEALGLLADVLCAGELSVGPVGVKVDLEETGETVHHARDVVGAGRHFAGAEFCQRPVGLIPAPAGVQEKISVGRVGIRSLVSRRA